MKERLSAERRSFFYFGLRMFDKEILEWNGLGKGCDMESVQKTKLRPKLKDNIGYIQKSLGGSTDLVIRELRVGRDGEHKAAVLFIDGLTDKKFITDSILDSLMLDIKASDTAKTVSSASDVVQALKDYVLTAGDIQDVADYETLFDAVLTGSTVILIDGHAQGVAAGTQGWEKRGVTETNTESTVRGPREGFSESLRTNTALIRRKIKNPKLWLETKEIGHETRTSVGIMYIKGIANEKIVEEVRSRLDKIDTDSILESGYIEEFIQDEVLTPFPTVYNSERPDVIAAEILEGKVAILVDGTPFVLIVPALFVSFLNSADDYYHRADISSLIRILRFVAMFIALLGPSLYVAVTTFHQEMLPTQLLIGLAAQREGVPFPAFVEAIMMELAFEILREAGLRMPRTIGPAVSIVGTLVIGSAAVEAGIVSAAMVIVVSTTAISSFVFPSYSMSNAFRMLRFPLMGLAGSFGLFGILAGIIAIVLHLCSLRTFGVPYMSPFAPFVPVDQKDAIIRMPHWALFSRPRLISQRDIIRGNRRKPRPNANPDPKPRA